MIYEQSLGHELTPVLQWPRELSLKPYVYGKWVSITIGYRNGSTRPHRLPPPKQIALSSEGSMPQSNAWLLGLTPESILHTAPWAVQSFLHGSPVCPADTHTHKSCYNCSSPPHIMLCIAMWPNNNKKLSCCRGTARRGRASWNLVKCCTNVDD